MLVDLEALGLSGCACGWIVQFAVLASVLLV